MEATQVAQVAQVVQVVQVAQAVPQAATPQAVIGPYPHPAKLRSIRKKGTSQTGGCCL